MEKELDGLRNALNRLRVWNAVLLGLIIILSVLVISDHLSDKESLSAESFQLVSPDGELLAELATQDGAPGLYLKDREGVNRVALFNADDGTGLYIMDAEGVTRIGIAQFAHGGGGVALHGPESKGAAVLYFKEEGSLRFFNAEGEVTNQFTAQIPQAED